MVPTRLRAHVPVLCAVLLSVPVMGWLGLYGFAWTDYDNEAAPAFGALVHGHLTEFVQLLPAYGGSLILRAPFALLPGVWGGGEMAVYRSVAIPCLLSAAVFAVWLAAQMRALGLNRLARAVAVALCVANPLTLRALELGHPEELLGAVLTVSAILAAMRGRAGLSGLLLGLAVANKPWAVLAVGPVLLALPSARAALTSLALAGAVALLVLSPILIVGSTDFTASTRAVVTGAGRIFQPWQLWWFFAHHGPVTGLFGMHKIGYRVAPAWVESLAHPLLIGSGALLTLLCLTRPRAQRDPLLLAVLIFALRSALDPWDTIYYLLPLSFALLSWEVLVRRDAPVFALATAALAWIVFKWAPTHVSADAQSVLYLLAMVPGLALASVRLYAPSLLHASGAQPLPVGGAA